MWPGVNAGPYPALRNANVSDQLGELVCRTARPAYSLTLPTR